MTAFHVPETERIPGSTEKGGPNSALHALTIKCCVCIRQGEALFIEGLKRLRFASKVIFTSVLVTRHPTA